MIVVTPTPTLVTIQSGISTTQVSQATTNVTISPAPTGSLILSQTGAPGSPGLPGESIVGPQGPSGADGAADIPQSLDGGNF